VEPFTHRLQGPAHIYDINSSFPYSMTFAQPGNILGRFKGWKEGDDLALVRARVTVPEMRVPALPYRDGSRVYFPTGTWDGWFSGVDLNFHLSCGGTIDRVFDCWRFSPMTDFREYVTDLYGRRRATSDSFQKLVLKYMMNSVYGKTAEGSLKDQLYLNKALPRGITESTPIKIGGRVRGAIFERESKIVHEHVPFAMSITAMSRRWITEGLHRVGDSAYCDTDSLTTRRPPDQFEDSDELGRFKLEESIGEDESAYFVAPKNYRFGRKFKAKGFSPRRRKKGLQGDEFEQIVSGSQVTVERMMRVKEVLRSGRTAPRDKSGRCPKCGSTAAPFTKSMQLSERPKRRSHDDGIETSAWSVSELKASWTATDVKRERALLGVPSLEELAQQRRKTGTCDECLWVQT
jgi:hypothetical protein